LPRAIENMRMYPRNHTAGHPFIVEPVLTASASSSGPSFARPLAMMPSNSASFSAEVGAGLFTEKIDHGLAVSGKHDVPPQPQPAYQIG